MQQTKTHKIKTITAHRKFYRIRIQKIRLVQPIHKEHQIKLNNKKFNKPTSYVGSVLASYGNMISKYKTDETIQSEIDSQLPTLQTYLKLYLKEFK